jgi:MFS family permease
VVKSLSIQTKYLMGMVVDSIGVGMFLPLSLLYFHHVTGLSITQVGTIMSSAAVVGLLGNPMTGLLIDRFGARTVVIGVYLLRAAGFATYPLVDNGVLMFIVVTLVALGDVSFSPSITSFIAEIVQGSGRDKLLGAQRSMRNAGQGAGGLIAGALLAFGSDAAFNAIVLITAGTFLAAAAVMRTIPNGRTVGAGGASRKRGYRLVARNRPFLTLTLLNIPIAFGYMVLAVSLPVYLTQELHTSSSLIGVLYAVNTVGIAVLQIPVTRMLIRYRRTRAVALGVTVFAASFLAFAVLGLISEGSVLLVGVFAATGLFTAGELMHGATASALVASAAPEATRGRHLAVYQLSWSVPNALAPAVLTALMSLSPTALWLILAAGIGGAAVGMLRLEPRLPEEAVRPIPIAPVSDLNRGQETTERRAA